MFKYVKRIKKLGLMSLLIILQLSIGMTMINTSGKLFEDSRNRKKGIENLFNIGNTTMVKIQPIKGYDDELEGDYWEILLKSLDAEKIYEDLKRHNIIKDFYIYGSDSNIYDEFRKKLPEKYENISEDIKDMYLGEILINENFFNHYKLSISSGRNLLSEDFKKDFKIDNIPILMGNDFEGIYKLGEKFKVKYISEVIPIGNKKVELKEDFITFEIVGFLERNAIPISNGPAELFGTTLLYSDGIKIIPTVTNYIGYNSITMAVDTALFLERTSKVSERELVDILNEKLKKYDLQADLYKLSNTTTIIESYERDVKSSLFLGGLLLILSIIGTSCIILGQLKDRKKEFGIKIAMGATLNDICKDIILETLFMVIVASIISLLLNINMGIGWSIVLINLIIVSITTLLISMFPIIEIKKMKIIDLVRKR